MKKFVFSLSALFEVKKTQRDKLQAEYAAAEAAHRACVEYQTALGTTLDEKKREFEERAGKGMTVADMQGYVAYFEEMGERIKAAARDAERARREADQKQSELVAVFKEIKVLDKLYEKQYAEYLKELEKSDTKLVEDIVSFKSAESPDAAGGTSI